MARGNYLYTEFSLNALKEKVQEKSGIQVSTMRYCNNLASKMLDENLFVSPHTIARFFRVIKSKSMTSLYTLDLLSQYVGYGNWSHFHSAISCQKQNQKPPKKEKVVDIENDSELSLVRFCVQDGAFGPLFNYFIANRDVFADASHPKTVKLLFTLTELLNSYPKIRHQLFYFLLNNDYLGKNYFSLQVNADAITTYYGDAVSQYFLRMINPSDKLYPLQLVWANALLMIQAFYSGNTKKLLQIGYELFKNSPPEINTLVHHISSNSDQVWIFARYHFVHILYLYYSGKASRKKMEQKVRFIIDQLTNAPFICKLISYSFIFEALTFTGYSNLILWFTTDYIALINSIKDIEKIKGEGLKSLTSLIFFFTLAAASQLTTSDFKTITAKIEGIKDVIASTPVFKPYFNTYNVYLNSLEAILAEDVEIRKQYFADARHFAQGIRNKYFVEQIDRLGQQKNFLE